MTDIGTFPTITNAAYSLGHTVTMTGSGSIDIKPGMVVAFNATGVTMTVEAADAGSGDRPIGVALTHSDVSESEKLTVMLSGIAYVANADDSATGDAGDFVVSNDNAVGGTVNAASLAGSGTTLAIMQDQVIGMLIEDLAASGTARILITPQTVTRANSS